MASVPLYTAEQIVIPPGLPDILKQFTKAAIKTQPGDIYLWAAGAPSSLLITTCLLCCVHTPQIPSLLDIERTQKSRGSTDNDRACLRAVPCETCAASDVIIPYQAKCGRCQRTLYL